MKKYLLATLGLSTVALFGMSSFTANAADEASSEAKTQGVMTFKIDDSDVDPNEPNVNKPENPGDQFKPEDIDPGTPEEPGNGSIGNGKKSFYINFAPNLIFKDVMIQGTDMTHISDPINIGGQDYAPFVQVTDNRGTADGWDLNLTATTFKSGEEELKGVSLNFKPGDQTNYITPMSGQSYDLAPKPLVQGSVLQVDGSSGLEVLSAAKGTGVGTWNYTFGGKATYDSTESGPPSLTGDGGFYQEGKGVEITVPASSLPKINKTYVSDLTWTLMASPTSGDSSGPSDPEGPSAPEGPSDPG